MKVRYALWVLGVLITAFTLTLRAAENPRDLAKSFFKNYQYASPKVSPNGRWLSCLVERGGTETLWVYDLIQKKGHSGVKPKAGYSVGQYFWGGPETLVYDWVKLDRFSMSWHAWEPGTRLSNLLPHHSGPVYLRMMDPVPNDPEHILMYDRERLEKMTHDVYRRSLETGSINRIADNPGGVRHWVADQQGTVRLGILEDQTKADALYRKNKDSDWKRMQLPREANPLAFDLSGENILLTYLHDSGHRGIGWYHFPTQSFRNTPHVDPPFSVAVSDIVYHLPTDIPVGVTYQRLRPRTIWFNTQYANWNNKLDQALPGYFHRILGLAGENNRFLLVESFSDRDPGFISRLDLQTSEITKIIEKAPWLQPDALHPMEPITFRNREGVFLQGYLTLPGAQANGPYPLVALVHGGPRARDDWGFDSEVQYLASLGYAVLQVNYRGSSGFGENISYEDERYADILRDAPLDVIDGVNWAIDQGVADPERIGIMGGSFGGYVTGACLTLQPDLFHCGISFAGIFDWVKIVDSDLKEMPLWVTTSYRPLKNNPQLARSLSPIHHVDKIKAPLLIAHGRSDSRVSVYQSKKMIKALQKAGKPHTKYLKSWVFHGFASRETAIAFYTKAGEFLNHHLQ